MLHYPKIPGSANALNGRCVAFEKLDGTNLHWCWDREFGWHGFGTRRDEFNLTPAGIAAFAEAHPGLEGAASVFEVTLAEPLDRALRDRTDFAAAKAFAEYLGPNSFAGQHKSGDPMRLVLFDVWGEGFGFLAPHQFVRDFGHLPAPRVVFEGKLTGAFLEAVRLGKYGVAEGVVCKGGTGGQDVWMVKVKTYTYLARLKASFGAKWEDFWE
jgi:hypothetical protein